MACIRQVVCAPALTGFFFDDQAAIRSGLAQDGFLYVGEPQTPRFTSVRMAGEGISVMLRLDDDQIAVGDCAAVQYSGAGGRAPLFLAKDYLPVVRERVAPVLVGRPLSSFRALAEEVEGLTAAGHPLHTAIRYGVSQAILHGVAKAQRKLPCEVIAEEYGTSVADRPIPIFAQSGDSRYENVDKMILKRADVLPHGLINSIPEKVGRDGAKLQEYVAWLRDRILSRRPDPAYRPTLHLDVYGTLGMVFNSDLAATGAYLARLGETARPFPLQVESPVDAGGREAQCEALAALRRELSRQGAAVSLVADEWCNTLEDTRLFADAAAADMIQIKTPDLGGLQNSVEAVLYCRTRGVGSYLGGTCNETDISARACVHVALATGPDQILAKPGMGVDEGLMTVHNEMQRALALLAARREGTA